jgi:hypothetical protein
VSLSDKLRELSETLVADVPENKSSQALSAHTGSQRLTSCAVDRLWLHVQRNLMTRSTPPIQPFVHRKAETTGSYESDELLELASDVILHTTDEDETNHSVDLEGKQNWYPLMLTQAHEVSFGNHELAPPREAFQDDLLLDAT